MGSMEEATTAVSMYDGVEFMGRRLRVSFPDRSRNELGPFPNSSAFPNSSLSNANKLFVGNLPWGMDDITLENIFSEHGKVLEARIVYDRESGRSRGFGLVTLSSSDEVNEAITKMDGAVSKKISFMFHLSYKCMFIIISKELYSFSALFLYDVL